MIDYLYQNEAQLRLSVFLGGFILLALWEWISPKRELTQAKFKRWFNNIALVVCSTVVVRVLVPTAAIGVAYFIEQEHIGLANNIDMPFWLKVLVVIIILDITIYFQHVIFHVLPILWRFHRVHHSDLDCDVTTGVRFHPVEILISIVIKFATIAALGAPVLAVIIFEALLNLMSMFTHSNIKLNSTFERILRWFVVTPDMHRVHHSARENETNSNFAFNISLWDRIFATYVAEAKAGWKNMVIGLDMYREPNWQNFYGLLTMPFATGVGGYAINYRDTVNTDEFSRVNMLVKEQTKSLRHAKEVVDNKNIELMNSIRRSIESERYQTMLIDKMIDGFIAIDEQGVIESFNPAAEHIFGYKKEEVIGQNIRLLMPKSEADHHDEHLARYKTKGEHHAIGISREIEGQRKDGSVFPIDVGLNEVVINGKKVFTSVVRDISQRRKEEEEILLAKENAEKANQAKTEFLSAMSHELRTPLNAIIGFSDLIATEDNIDPFIREQIVFIQQAGVDLLGNVENVLNLSQIEEGNANVVIKEISLHELLDECSMLMKPVAEKSNIQFTMERNGIADTILADRNGLKQALLNLLSNAMKYIDGGDKVTLKVEAFDDEGLRITVSDNGPGIDATRLNKIFEPFNRLGHEGSNIPGTGIGLSISKKLIELMNGTLNFKSVVGQGSQFWIDLPKARGRGNR